MLRCVVVAACLLAAEGPPAPPAGRLAREHFRGHVASFEGRRIEIQYDFSDPAHIDDWTSAWPFLRPAVSGAWKLDRSALRGEGNAGLRHRAVFDGEVRLVATLSCEDAKNFGALVLDEDRAVFDVFGIADTNFALLDRKPPLMHMVTTFLPPGAGPGGVTEWRYVQTGYEPRIGGLPFEMQVRKKGAANEFRFAGTGRLAGEDKEARVGPRLVPGLYAMGARVLVSRVVISGVLDAKWLREAGIRFEDRVPADPEPLPGEKEKEGAPSPAPGGGTPDGGGGAWQELLRKLSDASAPKADREKAAEELAATKERRALRPLIDLLYNEDDRTGREVAWKAFRGISGKDLGYRPDAPREARLKAMQRVWELWYAVKDALEREEKKKE